jgi:hypothetical protein
VVCRQLLRHGYKTGIQPLGELRIQCLKCEATLCVEQLSELRGGGEVKVHAFSTFVLSGCYRQWVIDVRENRYEHHIDGYLLYSSVIDSSNMTVEQTFELDECYLLDCDVM